MQHPTITKLEKDGPAEAKPFGTDACGSEVFEGDEILIIDGEFVLVENAVQYLTEHLGAKKEIAGEED
ncbi:YqaI family protein [Sutcliffiella cohnii]